MDELQEFLEFLYREKICDLPNLDGFTELLQSKWPSVEVEVIIAARIAGKKEPEIRELVDRLHANRVAYGEL